MAITQLEPREAKAAIDEAEKCGLFGCAYGNGICTGASPRRDQHSGCRARGRGPDAESRFFDRSSKTLLPDKDQPVFCGCQVGMRSQMAAELMARAGYSKLVNVQGGFGGTVENGVLVVAGWRDSNLPVETEVNDANSYASLKARGAKSE